MDKSDIEPLENLLDEMREIDGFPKGKDEDIIDLSDPPYYTACPNPYLNDFIEEYGTEYDPEADDYECEPFVGNVSEGKNDSIYRAYSYHTKVPHKAIQKYITHYTEEGEIVFDGFCGTGMTGIAAQETNRNSILMDLSSYASFIASSCNSDLDKNKLLDLNLKLINKLREETQELYYTSHNNDTLIDSKAIINYTVWSKVYSCPYCKNNYVLWDEAVIESDEKRVYKNKFSCSNCGAEISKEESEQVFEKEFDTAIGEDIKKVKEVPVLIIYSVENKRFEKEPDKDDIKLIEEINNTEIPYWYPTNRILEGDEARRNDKYGITHVHHFFTKRNIWVLSKFNDIVYNEIKEPKYRNFYINALAACLPRASKRNRYIPKYGNRHVGTLSGTLYCPYFFEENNLISSLERRIKKMAKGVLSNASNVIISNQSSSKTLINSNSIDYIFIDPPFGYNIMYSELNFIAESWLKVITNNKKEAIINKTQNKDLSNYTDLMNETFNEMYKILKPNRWITIEFHNSKAAVWNGIQEALTRAGFIIAQVSVLDKKKGTVKQLSSPGAVKNDLVINAYKPDEEFEEKFLKNAGEDMEADFIQQQLKRLPVEANIERTEQMLYSKMLAHYVENGFKIKYNSTNFFQLLHDNFVERDGYWFLEEQADQYDQWKSSLKLEELEDIKEGNQVMFVVDEKSALTWLYNFLDESKDFSEISTSYNQVLTKTKDLIPELKEMLDNNFVMEDGKYRRPKTKKEQEKIKKNRARELERDWKKLFDKAKNGKRKIKNVRKEALIHGFTKCYQEENYEDIVTVADRLYKSTLRGSGDILDFVDIARMKIKN